MRKRFAIGVLALALGSAYAVRPACAAEVSGGGDGAYVTVHEETRPLPGGDRLRQFRTAGFVTAQPGSPFERTEQNCSGTELVRADGTALTSAGYCDGTDPAGDVWWIWWRGDAQGGTWGLLGGTGKFAGFKGGGTLRYVDRWPNGKYTIKWEGSWTSE